MSNSYLSKDDAAAVLEAKPEHAQQQLPALSALLKGDLLWDQSAGQLVYKVETWIDGTGYGQRVHTCAARRVIGDNDLAFGFSNAAKTADPELVAAAADEILDILAAGISAADDAAASAAVTAVLYGGLAESPSRKPMFAALRAQQHARTLKR
ncbi:hypothetical protein L0U85_09425 [Glycomyces sp. L485]|uniref:hypothetical protein n=1 Tax=Glycomyces sp. L485 TaxID=2909235 RepID=UPI001F4BB9AF|nr:hypothetical protein [Glycomyces sp. L485]MCH7231070.1 hypothetical protein [Glycomyces sp. L485]